MVWTDLALVGATVEQLQEAQQLYPLKRYGQPEDIANLAIYLLSDASAWMTGSNIEITGGTQTL
jgi:NAD(P)-dependent dehydrogenase (short-subunit alcohol dehydrogenase family)